MKHRQLLKVKRIKRRKVYIWCIIVAERLVVITMYVYYSKSRRRKLSNAVTLTKQFLNRIILYLKGNIANAICRTFTKMNQPCKCVELHFQYRKALISGTYTNQATTNGHAGVPCAQLSISLILSFAESRNSLAVVRSNSRIPSII